MRYMGGKAKTGPSLVRRMLLLAEPYTHYIEPFVGAANTLTLVKGTRIASDINPFLIKMWQAVQVGWLPPDSISEIEYNHILHNPYENPPLTAFAGFACSFGAKWFAGYARNYNKRNFAKEGRNGLIRKSKYLKNVEFSCIDYENLRIPKNSLIYCDPPYKETTGYGNQNFDFKRFWNWCDNQPNIFISEFEAPEGWKCAWNRERAASLDLDTGSKISTEKLFTKVDYSRKINP